MALELTEAAINASNQVGIQPQLILEIDGVDTLYGALRVQQYIRIGDTGLLIGNTWVIGGLGEVEGNESLISLSGSTTSIKQQLEPDRGAVSSVSSIYLELIDKNSLISELVSPGFVLDDILGARAKLHFGFADTAYPEDFVQIFSGTIDEIDSGPGVIKFNISHPDQKKRQKIFKKAATALNGAINNAVTTLTVDSTTDFLSRVTGPDGAYDGAILFYVRIDDEIIQFTGLTATTFTGCTRGALGTTAASHADNATVTSYYVLESDAVDLALKIMLSGVNGPFRESVSITHFEQVPVDLVSNALFFEGIDIADKYGLTVGDYVTTTGASNGANNVSLKPILSIETVDEGSYLVIDDVTFVQEADTAAVVAFRSQYDTLGEGLGMSPEDVDVAAHTRWQGIVLSAVDYRFYLKDTIDGKDFIEKEIYSPAGAYSLPRKGRASLGLHIGPIPEVEIPILDSSNVKNPSRIRLRRSTNRNFLNTVVYKYDEDTLEDKFNSGRISTDETSKSRIRVGTAAFTLESKGMRTDLNAAALADQAALRRLRRYSLAAEYYENIEPLFSVGFPIEPGDLVVFDPTGLSVTNIITGDRDKGAKLYEVMNKSMNLRTGQISLNLVDTNFNYTERYGLISPSSQIATGSTTTEVVIEDSFGAIFPGDEKAKWEAYIGLPIIVHSLDFSFEEEVTLTGFQTGDSYTMLVSPALSAPPPAGYVVDIARYPTSTDQAENALYKLIHGHWAPEVAIASGASSTVFTVATGEGAKFWVGAPVRVHNEDFSVFSDETTVSDITGDVITVADDLGFTPSSSETVSMVGFADEQQCYRFV